MAYKDKEKKKANSVAYYAANKEKLKAYYAANKEKLRAAHATYKAANKEKKKAYNATYNAANKEKQKANSAAYYAANKEKLKADKAIYNRLRRTGVTQEQYDGAYLKQKGVCVICSGVEASGRKLSADHCHKTGVFRGLLCMKCNTAIGKLNDDAVLVEKALNYLKETQ